MSSGFLSFESDAMTERCSWMVMGSKESQKYAIQYGILRQRAGRMDGWMIEKVKRRKLRLFFR